MMDMEGRLETRGSIGLQKVPSNHNEQAASLVAQYLTQSPRSASDIATGYGALKRGKKQGDAERQGLQPQSASTTAIVQQHASSVEESAPLEEAATKIQQFYRKHRSTLSLRRRSFSKFGEEAFELIKRYVDTGESGTGLYENNIAVKARLVLHFDINKTILMTDRAQGANTAHMINVLLCECAWGRLEPGPAWVPVGRLATDSLYLDTLTLRKRPPLLFRPSNDPQLMSYRSFLDSFLLPSEPSGPDADKRNREVKNRRQTLKRTFTEAGQPGEMFRGIFQQLQDTLMLPEACKKAAQQSSLGYLFGEGERHILPSFFNLLIHLQKQKRDFTLVFRTFGTDTLEVIDEVNMFATGQHPAYPQVRMDGSDGRTDLRMSIPATSGCFVRMSAKRDGSLLLIGADKSLLKEKNVYGEHLEASASAGQGRLVRTFQEMHEEITGKAEDGNTAYAIRDYYPFWKSRNERSRAGKLLLLDPADDDVIQIFFDDNIGHGSANIVDVRDVRTGEALAFQDVNGKHLLKVEPLNAILDPHYFVRAVHQCTLSVLHGREAAAFQNAAANAGFGRDMPRLSPSRGYDSAAVALRPRAPPAAHSRRARELWTIMRTRLSAVIRLQAAMRNS